MCCIRVIFDVGQDYHIISRYLTAHFMIYFRELALMVIKYLLSLSASSARLLDGGSATLLIRVSFVIGYFSPLRQLELRTPGCGAHHNKYWFPVPGFTA